MKPLLGYSAVLCVLALNGSIAIETADPGWPRVFKDAGLQLTVYQPQVDYWHGYSNLHFRSAIAVKGVGREERFGVAEVDALTVTDHAVRIVAVVPLERELRFLNVAEPELSQLRQAVDRLSPTGQATTLALDRVVAYLDPAQQTVQKAADVNLDPPDIYYSTFPAILVMFMGEPRFTPVETNRTDLLFALNTNWDVLYDSDQRQYYLLNGEGWLTAPNVMKGPWAPVSLPPPSLYSLPDGPNWAEVRRRLPGKQLKTAPRVFVTTEPAELILTDGPPQYTPIDGTRLLRVSNTKSALFLNSAEGKLYFLVAGRWFRGSSLNGPWTSASADLPEDFKRIPQDDPAAFVRASVPGTREAQDAVLLASIPTTTVVNVTNAVVQVTYSGPPQFVTITNTIVQCAVNSPQQVFLVSGKYYCCDQGVWFTSSTATGPWAFSREVPSAIYTIPPSNPNYNVTYVIVQNSTPTTVTYSATSGYSGEYVAATGVLMFGMGVLVGAAIADDDHHYYYPPYPCHYSYGCGATYHYGYGGYYAAGGAVYGPYGGAGYTAGYNPSTGTYSRSSYAYGPYGSASRSAAYNPYTGSYAGGAQVNTAYGSAGRYGSYNAASGTYSAGAYRSSAYGTASAERTYNPYTGQSTANRSATTQYGSASRSASYNAQTGARAGAGSVSTAQGTASRGVGYNPTTSQGAAGRSVSGQYGSAGQIATTGGSSATAWNTQQGQGAVARSSSGDVYAGTDGTVYKRDSEGSWSKNSGSGWESMDQPQPQGQGQPTTREPRPQAQSASTQQRQSLENQAQARQSGNYQATRTTQYHATGSTGGGRSSTRGRSSGYSRGGRR